MATRASPLTTASVHTRLGRPLPFPFSLAIHPPMASDTGAKSGRTYSGSRLRETKKTDSGISSQSSEPVAIVRPSRLGS
jgi:hypothetical protein